MAIRFRGVGTAPLSGQARFYAIAVRFLSTRGSPALRLRPIEFAARWLEKNSITLPQRGLVRRVRGIYAHKASYHPEQGNVCSHEDPSHIARTRQIYSHTP
jgi:hypothetical protein